MYTLLYFNKEQPLENKLKIMQGQENVMKFLDNKFPLKYGGLASPLIIIGGKVYEMINPTVFACLLNIPNILEELKNQETGPYGAVEVTNISPYGMNPTV